MKIAIASDHGGFDLKEFVKKKLIEMEHEVDDVGCANKESCDYPEYGFRAARAVSRGKADRGIMICTTGIGMSMVGNKVKGVRAALCYTSWSAKLSRNHNNSNVLAMGSAFVDNKTAEEIIKVWLEEEFEGGRHERRVNKIMEAERSIKNGTSEKN